MGIDVVRDAVRRPARVRDADISAQLLPCEEMFEVRDLAFAFVNVERTVLTIATPALS